MNKDLTVGKTRTVLWQFCLPLIGSVLFQQLYNLADSFVAGKLVSENALAAVGNGYEITLIFIAFSVGCNIGCSVVVSQLFGAKAYKDLKTAVSTMMIAGIAICAVLMLLGILFCRDFLLLIRTPKEILEDSLLYLTIYIAGFPFVFFYNIATGIFSALGDSRMPFLFLAVSSLTNIAMDIFFVTTLRSVFPRGVDGVAWATFICQGVSCILAMAVILRRLGKLNAGKAPLFSAKLLKKLAALSVPSVLQQCCVSIGNIILQSLINGFGTPVVAGYAAAVKLNNLTTSSVLAIGNGISNYTGQNYGAKKFSRLREGFREGLLITLAITVPITLCYVFAGQGLIRLFMESPTGQATDVGVMFLRIVAPFYFMVSIKLSADGVLRGLGKMRLFMIDTFADLILRVILAFILAVPFRENGIWMSWPLGWLVGTGLSILFYVRTMKKTEVNSL